MLLANSDLISRHPAQLYYSVLPFLPSDTCLARYPTPRGCISVLTGRENSWLPTLFTLAWSLEDTVITFAPGGHMFAVGHEDGIHIYNASNGLLNSSIGTSCMGYRPLSAAFTEDGCGVVVVLHDDWTDRWKIERFDLVTQNSQIWIDYGCDDDDNNNDNNNDNNHNNNKNDNNDTDNHHDNTNYDRTN